ncbi:MAG: hypothetical protein ACKN83_07790 [Vulcanococcus sp.]
MTATSQRPPTEAGITPTSPLAVEQLLRDLRSDVALQQAFLQASPERILGLCQERGVYVNPQLLAQFIAQAAADEMADEELSLDQLADVAGGLGIADVMVSGAVLAVVASNAGGLMSQAQAAISGGDGPVASLTADATIAGQVHTLESLGIQVVVGEPTIDGASAQWDSGSRTMTISADTMKAGAPSVLQAMNHESVHVAQSCKAGGVGEAGRALGIATSGEAAQAVQHDTYAGISAEEKQMELEAYTLTNQAGAGVAAAVQHCSG